MKDYSKFDAHAVQKAALNYIRRGWRAVPAIFGGKDRYNTLTRIKPDDVPFHFDRPCNVAIVLGAESGWLVDVDVDNQYALALADEYLPPTDAMFGRKSKPNSHRLYIVNSPVGLVQHNYVDRWGNNKWIVELRAGLESEQIIAGELRHGPAVVHTIFPPSVHQSGEIVEWNRDGEPAKVNTEQLLDALQELRAATGRRIESKLGIW